MTWKIGDKVSWWQSSEWDSEVPRLANGVIEKCQCPDYYNSELWVRDIDTNDCHALNDFKLERRSHEN